MASPGALVATSPTSGMPSSARLPQVYQIDFTAVASGKRIASTKRRVRWRFGFANPEALANGETGTACRGEEHDITLVWSVTSGKRLILADGQEVHYSNSRSGVLDYSWTMRGNHVLKVVAHASPPISATPGFRQYDFFVDGQSFFTFPKVYKLGLSPNDPRAISPSNSPPSLAQRSQPYNNYSVPGGGPKRGSSTDIAALEAPHTADEEAAYLSEAIKLSLQDSGPPPSSSVAGGSVPPSQGGDLLLDFSEPAAASVPALPAPAAYPEATTNGFAAPPPAQPYAPQPTSPPAPAAFNPAAAVAPQPTLNGIATEFPAAPAPAAPAYPAAAGYPAAPAAGTPAIAADPYSQQPAAAPAFASPEAQPALASPPAAPMMQQYEQPAAAPAFAPAAPAFGAASPPDPTSAAYAPQPPAAPVPEPAPAAVDPAALTMNSLSGQPGSLTEGTGTGGSMADQAFMKLANLGDFDLVSKKESPRANPFDSGAASSTVGQASLADMKAQKQTTPKQDIMRPSPQGAMVVSNTQQGNFGGYGQYGASPMSQAGQSYGQPAAYDGSVASQPGQAPAYGAQPQYGQPPPQPAMGQYGQPAMGQPQQYQQPPPAQPAYGQQPFQQQGFGAPSYQGF